MKHTKLFTLAILAMVTLFASSCHKKMHSKQSYMASLYKDLKSEMGDARVRRNGDTVRVIYPELAMFDFGKDQIKPEAVPAMSRFAAILKKYDRVYFHINGYTDNVGTDDVNLSLSQRRAESAMTLFSTNGIASARMMTAGMGSADPIMSNATADGRQANRRVEFVLYENPSMKK